MKEVSVPWQLVCSGRQMYSKDFGKAYLDSIKSANCSGELYDVIKSLVP